jgi:Zn-dependent protease with chaperone function
MATTPLVPGNFSDVDPFQTSALVPFKNKVILEGLPANAFRHPLDLAATNALSKTKGFEAISKFLVSSYVERLINIENISEYIRVGPSQFPEIYDRYVHLATVLAVPRLPDLFIMNSSEVNAYAMGIQRYTIRVTSALIDIMTDDELDAILAHELGHVKCEHVKYSTMTFMLEDLGAFASGLIPIPGVGDALFLTLQLALLEWDRKTEFSSDRAALLGVQDVKVVQSALGKLAGYSHEKNLPINVEALVEQAAEFDDIGANSLLEKALKMKMLMSQTHPYPVVRVREIGEWAQSAQYKAILRKEYEPVKDEMWYVAVDGEAVGPMTLHELRQALESGQYVASVLVFTQGMTDWTPANQVESVSGCCPENGRSHLPSIPEN